MTYADTLLSDGERVTLRAHQHPLALLFRAVKAILLIVGALALLVLGGLLDPTGWVGTVRAGLGWGTLVLFLIGAALIALAIANWMNEEYIVTNRRVMKVNGLINKHSADSSLEKINDAVLDQNLFGRMFNYGDLDIITAAEETVDRYKMLQGVITFKKEILYQKHSLEFDQMRPPVSAPLRAAPTPPPAMTMGGDVVPAAGMAAGGGPAHSAARTMTPAEVTQTLAGLADLRDRGALSPEEYEAKKTDLLSRL